MIGFQRGINLIFSLFIEGEYGVFSTALRKRFYIKRENLYNDYNFNL
jgi:hypothetical protein